MIVQLLYSIEDDLRLALDNMKVMDEANSISFVRFGR